MRAAIIIALALLLAGCEDESDPQELYRSGMGQITKHYDKEYGVICYRYTGYGISCLKAKP